MDSDIVTGYLNAQPAPEADTTGLSPRIRVDDPPTTPLNIGHQPLTPILILLGLRERARSVQELPRFGFNLMQVCLALLTLLALLVLVSVIPSGLLGLPDMHIAGNGSSARHLRWMLDRSTGALPRGGVLSLPLWCYKLAILAWALWLANALVHWLRWAFGAWSQGGYWRGGKAADASDPQPQADDA